MAASFLQYCAMCEKQILTPSNAIIYCSEACCRKDSCKPLDLAVVAMNPTMTPPSVAPSSPHPFLPARIPRTSATTASMGIHRQNVGSDISQTKWTPRLPSPSNSDAFRYLSQFYRSIPVIGSEPPGEEGGQRLFSHRSTGSLTTPSLSLSQTSSTTCSSLSIGADFDLNTSPLQSRHNQMYSASAGTKKSVDLVVAPSAAASLPSQFDDRKYEKRSLAKMSAWPA